VVVFEAERRVVGERAVHVDVPELAATKQLWRLATEIGDKVRSFGGPFHHVGDGNLDPFALAGAGHVEQIVPDLGEPLAIGDVVEERLDGIA